MTEAAIIDIIHNNESIPQIEDIQQDQTEIVQSNETVQENNRRRRGRPRKHEKDINTSIINKQSKQYIKNINREKQQKKYATDIEYRKMKIKKSNDYRLKKKLLKQNKKKMAEVSNQIMEQPNNTVEEMNKNDNQQTIINNVNHTNYDANSGYILIILVEKQKNFSVFRLDIKKSWSKINKNYIEGGNIVDMTYYSNNIVYYYNKIIDEMTRMSEVKEDSYSNAVYYKGNFITLKGVKDRHLCNV